MKKIPRTHFNGYCKYESDHVVTLSDSPFNLKLSRHWHLFFGDQRVFYPDCRRVECDVKYERLVKQEQQCKVVFAQYEKVAVPVVNSEELRRRALEQYPGWVFVEHTPQRTVLASNPYGIYIFYEAGARHICLRENDAWITYEPTAREITELLLWSCLELPNFEPTI